MYTFIDTLEDLYFLNQELLKKPIIAVDTEFRRTNKFNMRLALLQINDGEETFLIDTIKLIKPEAGADFLFSKSVKKIFHSCKEDLEAIFSWTDRKMINIFDTQLASSLLGDDYSISDQQLVEDKLGVSLEKSETRSNWIRRPLSESQLKYAALDVEYLIYIFEEQEPKLNKSNKLSWHDEEINRLIDLTLHCSGNQDIPRRVLTSSEENELLNQFNVIVEKISKIESVNPTFLFSKKAQKDFIRTALSKGIDYAFEMTANWRVQLLRKDLVKILK